MATNIHVASQNKKVGLKSVVTSFRTSQHSARMAKFNSILYRRSEFAIWEERTFSNTILFGKTSYGYLSSLSSTSKRSQV